MIVYCVLMCSAFFLLIHYSDESVLRDLKHLLIEAKQKLPPVLEAIEDENEEYINIGGKNPNQDGLIVVMVTYSWIERWG